jgi:hypothetical protein
MTELPSQANAELPPGSLDPPQAAPDAQGCRAAYRELEELVRLCGAEDALMPKLARPPCASDDEFFIKAQVILEWQMSDHCGAPPSTEDDFGFVAIALAERLKERTPHSPSSDGRSSGRPIAEPEPQA